MSRQWRGTEKKVEIMSAENETTARSSDCVRHVVQGAVAASDAQNIVYTAVLGAGALVCLHDPVCLIGGVAHFLFPDGSEYGAGETRFGGPALTALIARLIGLGAESARLEAKLFGGAKMHDGRRDLGQRNIAFALHFLEQSGISVLEQGIGGDHVRRVRFCPNTGQCEELLMNAGLSHETLTVFGATNSVSRLT